MLEQHAPDYPVGQNEERENITKGFNLDFMSCLNLFKLMYNVYEKEKKNKQIRNDGADSFSSVCIGEFPTSMCYTFQQLACLS